MPKRLPRGLWLVMGQGATMMMAHFSEALLVLEASEAGLAKAYVPLVTEVMSLVSSLAPDPVGALSDRAGAGFALLTLVGLVAMKPDQQRHGEA